MHPTFTDAWPDPPHVIAHRGGGALAPESTLVAFDLAARLGVDALELDVHLSADDELVVIHDATVDRTTDGVGAVADLTWPELARLDAAAAWRPPGGGAPAYRGTGVGVPRFVDVARAHPGRPLGIDVKPPGTRAATALCDALRREGRTGDVVVGSFHEDAMAAFRAACPEAATAATPREVRTFVLLARARLAGPYRPPFDVLQVPVERGRVRVVTPAVVRAAHAKGIPVHAWTIDDRAQIDGLLRMGVDGIIGDRPDRALRAVGRPVDAALLPPGVTP
jgi:glycerophosphoryl diester phosphodiesterase